MTAPRLALLAVALAALARPAAAQQPELKRVYVLIAAEVTDKSLAKMVQMDVKNFKQMLDDHLPGDQVIVKELTGKELTASNVLTYYKNLPVTKTDALVFYYSGHGSYRAAGQPGPAGDVHTLEFQYDPEMGKVSTEAMKRKELKEAMKAKGAGLTVILTDCCSDHVEIPPPPDHKPIGRTRGVAGTTLGRSLFLTARGMVDMTAAADGQVAVSDTLVGSYFTAALARSAVASKDKAVSWQAFAGQIKDETQRVYKQEADRLKDKEMQANVRTKKLQLPETFELPPPAGGGTAEAPKAGKNSYAVIALSNPTADALTLQVRWGTTGKWSDPFTAQANKFQFAAVVQPTGKPAVLTFQVRVNGGEPKTLQAKLVTKDSKPTREEGNVYELPDCKPAAAKPAGRVGG